MKVIKIGAVWCSGCLVMKPRWEAIEKENPWLKTDYLDYDNDEEKVKKLKIKAERLPVFIFLDKRGQEFLRLSGEYSKDKLIGIINKNKGK
jgi:thiol-disulfide isomerase/thioredoxin